MTGGIISGPADRVPDVDIPKRDIIRGISVDYPLYCSLSRIGSPSAQNNIIRIQIQYHQEIFL